MISQERRGEIGDGQVKAFGVDASKTTSSNLLTVKTRWGALRFRKKLFFFLIALAVVHASFSTAGCAVFMLAAALSQQERDAVQAIFNTDWECAAPEEDVALVRQAVRDAVIASRNRD